MRFRAVGLGWLGGRFVWSGRLSGVPVGDGASALRWMPGRKAEFPCGLTEGVAEALCCRPGSVEVLCCRPGGVEVLCCWFECVGIFG